MLPRSVLSCPPSAPASLGLVFLLDGLVAPGPVRGGDAGRRGAGEVGLLIIHFNKNERAQRELCACGVNSMRGWGASGIGLPLMGARFHQST